MTYMHYRVWAATLLLGTWVGCASEGAVNDDDRDAGAECNTPEDCDYENLGPLAEGVATLTGASVPGMIDGARGFARFDNPVNVVVGPDGSVYVSDYNNDRVRVVTPEGDVATLVVRPDFERPFGLVLTPDGRTLYVQTDRNDSQDRSMAAGTIWRVDIATGAAEVVARNLGRPRGLALMPDGRLTLVDSEHHTVRLLDPTTGAIVDLAGVHDMPGSADGKGALARFNRPVDAVVDAQGNILVCDDGNAQIRMVAPDGVVTTFAGADNPGFGDGPQLQARFSHPLAIAIDGQGNVFVADSGNYRIRRIATDGRVTTIAGSGDAGFLDGGDPMSAQLFGLEGLDVNREGGFLYIADGNRGEDLPYHRVRRMMVPND